MTPPPSESNSAGRLVICALGICACYMYYGMVQESLLSRRRIGPSFVLLIQCVTNSIVARVWQTLQDQWFSSSSSSSETPKKAKITSLHHPLLALTSLCYVSAMVCSNESLHYVSYPTAVLAKSCKLIPTMAMGVLVEHKTYQLVEWMAALFITFGIVIFNFSRMQNAKGNDDSSVRGLALLSLSLLADGFLGSCQGLLKSRKKLSVALWTGKEGKEIPVQPPTAVETMLYVNLYAVIYLIPLTIFNQQMKEGLAMLRGTIPSSLDPAEEEEGSHQALLYGLFILNLTTAAGQIFIFLTITWYSSLVCTTITTTRKFFTILLSIMYFGHHFTVLQWIATGLVFTGLYLGIMGKRTNTNQPQEQQQLNGNANGKKTDTMSDFSTTHYAPRRTEGVKQD